MTMIQIVVIDWLFLISVQVVPVYNNCDPKKPIEETSKSLAVSWCSKESRERKAIEKATEAARKAYEGLSI